MDGRRELVDGCVTGMTLWAGGVGGLASFLKSSLSLPLTSMQTHERVRVVCKERQHCERESWQAGGCMQVAGHRRATWDLLKEPSWAGEKQWPEPLLFKPFFRSWEIAGAP